MTVTCNQEKCGRRAAFRFTWPGRDEAGICDEHAPKLRGVAAAIGLHLQLIPLTDADVLLELANTPAEGTTP